MPQKKYLVTLTPEERDQLTRLSTAGKASARTLTHARILRKADQAAGGRCKSRRAVSLRPFAAPQPLGRVPASQPDARGPQREEQGAADRVRRVAGGEPQRPGRLLGILLVSPLPLGPAAR
jgi:hypothetical protein